MGGNSQATTEQANAPIVKQPMPSSITPVYMNDPFTGQAKVDPLSYSDPTNMPDPLIEALKWLVGSSSGANNAPKRR